MCVSYKLLCVYALAILMLSLTPCVVRDSYLILIANWPSFESSTPDLTTAEDGMCGFVALTHLILIMVACDSCFLMHPEVVAMPTLLVDETISSVFNKKKTQELHFGS